MALSYKEIAKAAAREKKSSDLGRIIVNVSRLVITGFITERSGQSYYSSDLVKLNGEEALIMVLIMLGLGKKEIDSMSTGEKLTYLYLFGRK